MANVTTPNKKQLYNYFVLSIFGSLVGSENELIFSIQSPDNAPLQSFQQD